MSESIGKFALPSTEMLSLEADEFAFSIPMNDASRHGRDHVSIFSCPAGLATRRTAPTAVRAPINIVHPFSYHHYDV